MEHSTTWQIVVSLLSLVVIAVVVIVVAVVVRWMAYQWERLGRLGEMIEDNIRAEHLRNEEERKRPEQKED